MFPPSPFPSKPQYGARYSVRIAATFSVCFAARILSSHPQKFRPNVEHEGRSAFHNGRSSPLPHISYGYSVLSRPPLLCWCGRFHEAALLRQSSASSSQYKQSTLCPAAKQAHRRQNQGARWRRNCYTYRRTPTRRLVQCRQERAANDIASRQEEQVPLKCATTMRAR